MTGLRKRDRHHGGISHWHQPGRTLRVGTRLARQRGMQPLPHRYAVVATVAPGTEISLESPGVPRLPSDAPVEFDGPGTYWSPEILLTGAMADCLALTFRGIARARRLPFIELRCEVEGILDRVDGRTLFTTFHVRACLRVP